MTPLYAIQKDRGCTVGPGCDGSACTCKRMVRLVLEGMRVPTPDMLIASDWQLEQDEDVMARRGKVCSAFMEAIDTALKEVG